PVPTGLAARLIAKSTEQPAQSTLLHHKTAAATTAAATAAPKQGPLRRYLAVAASVTLAVAITLTVALRSDTLSAADLRLHDNVLQHVQREEPRFNLNAEDLDMEQI